LVAAGRPMGGDVSINPQINETPYRKFCKPERCAGIPFPEQRRKREAAPTPATQPAEAEIQKLGETCCLASFEKYRGSYCSGRPALSKP
jgi:hypothetical protein